MSRVKACFEQLKAKNKTALIPYLTAGDPQPDCTVKAMHALVEGGADIVEVGVPFSDPMADGPVIQQAVERALAHDVSLTHVLAMVKEFRQKDDTTPIILMGYLNPIEVMGYEKFIRAAHEAGVDGNIIVDLPPEEADEYIALTDKYELSRVFLVAPTTTEARIKIISDASSGYIYYVSLKGVTGAASLNVAEVTEKMAVMARHTNLPISVGFGIKDAESAAAVSKVAEGVVVGSAIVNRMKDRQDNPGSIPEELCQFMRNLRLAMDSA
ncbi:MAG: tryptophan synthase subunit alpha [Pseudomonadales bacterium]|nr:tryptophan synthase subunit alpha [Pseudomonadales bacterium]